MGHSRPLFLYFRLFNTQLTVANVQYINKFLPMTGFEPQTFCIRSDCSTNWATTTARLVSIWKEKTISVSKVYFPDRILSGNCRASLRSMLQNFNSPHNWPQWSCHSFCWTRIDREVVLTVKRIHLKKSFIFSTKHPHLLPL